MRLVVLKGANWKYSNQMKDVIPDYLVIIVGYMMQIMSKSDVVVTCKERFEFWIKLGSGGDNKPRKCAKLCKFAASFLLAIIRWTQQTNKCAKLLCCFFVFKSPGCWSLVPELIGNSRQSPPIQWSWNILLKTQQSWQWRSSINDLSPSKHFQRRLPGWMVGICLNRLATNMDTRALYKSMRSSGQTHKQSPKLGHADRAWKVGGAEGELELNLVAIVLQRAPGLEFACHHLEKCFPLILFFTSYIFFSYHLQ